MSAFVSPLHRGTITSSTVSRRLAMLLVALAVCVVLGMAWHSHIVRHGLDHRLPLLAILFLAGSLVQEARGASLWLVLCALATTGQALHAVDPAGCLIDGAILLACLGLSRQACARPIVRIPAPAAATFALALGGGWLLAAATAGGGTGLAAQSIVLGLTALGVAGVVGRATPTADSRARAVLARLPSTGGREPDGTLTPANPIWAYALERDKTCFAAKHGNGAAAYRLCGGVALAAGEPIGPAAERVALAAELVDHCRAQGWIPAPTIT